MTVDGKSPRSTSAACCRPSPSQNPVVGFDELPPDDRRPARQGHRAPQGQALTASAILVVVGERLY